MNTALFTQAIITHRLEHVDLAFALKFGFFFEALQSKAVSHADVSTGEKLWEGVTNVD